MAMQELGRLRRFPCLHCAAATNIPGQRRHRLFDLQSTFPVRPPSRDLEIRRLLLLSSQVFATASVKRSSSSKGQGAATRTRGFKGFETLQPKMPIQVRPVKPVELTSRERT